MIKMKLKIIDNTKLSKEWFCDPEHIYAFGDMELEENDKSQRVLMSIQVMLDALNALKTLGFEEISIRIQNDFPILITDTESKNKLNGL